MTRKPKAKPLSRETITERLLAIAATGEAAGAGPMLSLARAALMDAARLNGLAGEKDGAGGPTLEDLLGQIDENGGEGGAGDGAEKPGDPEGAQK